MSDETAQKMTDAVFPTKNHRYADQASQCGENRQCDEHKGHGNGAFVDPIQGSLRSAKLPVKRENEQPRHVEGGQTGAEQSEEP